MSVFQSPTLMIDTQENTQKGASTLTQILTTITQPTPKKEQACLAIESLATASPSLAQALVAGGAPAALEAAKVKQKDSQ